MEKTIFKTNDGENAFYLLEKSCKDLNYEPCVISEDEFKEGIKTHFFVDTDEFVKLQAKEIKSKNSKKVNGKETETKETETKEEKQKIDVNELLIKMSQMESKLNLLSLENSKLQQLQNKKVAFADAEKFYKRKASLLKDLTIFQSIYDALNSIGDLKTNKDTPLNAEDYRLNLQIGYNTDVLKTNNVLIIKEFISFISLKIENKVKEIKTEIETIDFI